MTEQTWETTDKKGHLSVWTWEETPELLKFKQQQERLRIQDAAAGYDTEGK